MSEAKVTSQDVWKILKETGEKIKETGKKIDELRKSQKETDRQMKETDKKMQETDRQMQETDRQMKETDKRMQETDRQMKQTDKLMEKQIKETKRLEDLFTGQWGKLMETLVEGDLIKLLKEKEIPVEQTAQNLKGTCEGRDWEIDILAINGDEVVVVEVKTTLTVSYVDNFIKNILKRFTLLSPLYKEKTIYGAVAYLKANQGSHTYAEKKGLFVIKATGSSSSIINEKGFRPKKFP